ncbi:DUF1564 family protein [Leptospira adleri]|uniref:DUF1564 family protein n=1 Tax=Leptospira adleri TaxID=2023186 RepID=UPI001083C3C0|nr:DUF1564 family protein [Leptospira adleri]TGM61904.1 DUF1564 family protein [Leptospira adleri]
MGKIKHSNVLNHLRSLSENRKKYRISEDSKAKRISASDLWIPKRNVPALQRRISEFGSLKNFLHFLLTKNRLNFFLLLIPSKNEKTIYQDVNLELVRFPFRPDSSDWAELRVVARYYGLSICNFFVILLQMEENENKSRKRFVFKSEKNANFGKKEKQSGISLVQKILPGRRFISFSLFFLGDFAKKFASDS